MLFSSAFSIVFMFMVVAAFLWIMFGVSFSIVNSSIVVIVHIIGFM